MRGVSVQGLNSPAAFYCVVVQLFQVLCERVYLDQAQVKVRKSAFLVLPGTHSHIRAPLVYDSLSPAKFLVARRGCRV